ncbi:hypothetical protein MKW94_018857 [Papaver nudicaule]|uniref:Photosystem II subunit Q-2 n=1 Tax=Papaver nudicaule TaxID=74823 RepID=A0AA41SD70_PAPNU|nr:hypothetical protein [Papaver nudicaule]
MAQAIASVSGLSSFSQGSNRLNVASNSRTNRTRSAGFSVRSEKKSVEVESTAQSSRRALLGVLAAGLTAGSLVKNVLAEARPIVVGPPPPPSGGLPGTLNSDEARDLDLPLKTRFYLQPKTPAEAAQRAKDSAQDILTVKTLIDKKAWPYVQNDLRSKAEYLRYDLKTIISAKPKDEKKSLKELSDKLFQNINSLDYAAKTKSTPEAEKYYAETVATLNEVLAKIG